MTKPAVLDVQQMRLSSAGVDGFYWPIAREELLAFRDGFLENLCGALRQAPPSDRWGQAIVLLVPHLLAEAMNLFRAHTLVRRARADRRSLVLARTSVLTKSIWSEQQSPLGALPGQLLRGFSRPSALRRTVRACRDFASFHLIPRKTLQKIDNELITVSLGSVIELHAKVIKERVSLIRFEEWFPPLSSSDGSSLEAELPKSWRTLLDAALNDGFVAANGPLPDSVRNHIFEWVTICATEVDRNFLRLISEPKFLPRELWRGTGGNVWNRILSAACRHTGRQVTGHDHALGISMFQTAHDQIVEHIACDRFVMWSEPQVRYGRKNFQERFSTGQPPLLEALPGKRSMTTKVSPHRALTGRKVLYVGTVYTDDRLTFTPLYPAPVMIDWEARLITELLSAGYEVHVKPHPESVFLHSPDFAHLGARVLDGKAEGYFPEYDVLVFSECISTPFFHAIQTKIPIMVADVGLHKWQPDALERLKRRCGFVNGRLDEENRILIDWDVFRSELRSSFNRDDITFAREMLGC